MLYGLFRLLGEKNPDQPYSFKLPRLKPLSLHHCFYAHQLIFVLLRAVNVGHAVTHCL